MLKIVRWFMLMFAINIIYTYNVNNLLLKYDYKTQKYDYKQYNSIFVFQHIVQFHGFTCKMNKHLTKSNILLKICIVFIAILNKIYAGNYIIIIYNTFCYIHHKCFIKNNNYKF